LRYAAAQHCGALISSHRAEEEEDVAAFLGRESEFRLASYVLPRLLTGPVATPACNHGTRFPVESFRPRGQLCLY